MSEAAPEVHAPKGDVKLPGLGPVPKKWFLIVGGGSVVVIAYVMWKKHSAAGPATAASPGASTGTSSMTGQPCVDENGNPGVYDDTGTCQVDTSALGGYYAGEGAGGVSGTTAPVAGTGGFTTNGQWTQQVETDMQTLGTGVDPGTLSAALGAYIAGSPVTPAQQSLIDQGISIDGYPPVAGTGGYPPSIKNQPATTTPPTPPPVATTPPGGVTKYPAPTGLKAESVGISSVILSWKALSSPTPLPASYTVAVWDKAGALVHQSTATAPDEPGGIGQVTVSDLKTKTAYHAKVWANGGKVAPPGATVTFTTH